MSSTDVRHKIRLQSDCTSQVCGAEQITGALLVIVHEAAVRHTQVGTLNETRGKKQCSGNTV